MKNFLRSVAGKTVLFVLVIIMLVTAAASAFSVALLAVYGFYDEKTDIESAKRRMEKEYFISYVQSDAYSAAFSVIRDGEEPYTPDSLDYAFYDETGKQLSTNYDAAVSANDDIWSYRVYIWKNETFFRTSFYNDPNEVGEKYIFCANPANLREGYFGVDRYSRTANLISLGYSLRYVVVALLAVSIPALLAAFITLMCVSGRRPNTEEIVPGALNRVPFDVLFLVCVSPVFAVFVVISSSFNKYTSLGFSAVFTALSLCTVLGLAMSFAVRIKEKTLIKNTVVYRIVRLLGRFFRAVGRFFSSVPLVPKTAVGALALTVAEFAFMLRFIYDPKYLIIIWVAEKLILIPLVIYSAVNLRKLQKAGKAVAEGNLEYKTDTRSLFGDFKRFGEDMNRISDGMSAEVEKRTHSDRMKTELITNVSHDLKTPLTSLVNYSDLICAEKCDNEKISEYAEVIHRQSLRLKRLIDDLVEASKAQSGVLDVCLAPCDVSTFVNQVSGEYGDRLASAELEPVIRLPSEPVYIFADPRRLLRVFDNLLTNICKYAKHGTRVYLDVAQDGNTARITFRNVSERALDIDGEELAERFVRADASRNTEGNGLGLSIAKSLVELQNGKMKITVDGDLFKVTLTFPLSKPVE